MPPGKQSSGNCVLNINLKKKYLHDDLTRSLGTNNLVINVLVLVVVVVVVVVFRFVPFRRKCCWLANVFNFFYYVIY